MTFDGRVLYLTEDPAELEAQLGGKTISYDPDRALLGNISTDELTPGWVCYYYDETLARYCLVGLRGGKIKQDAIKGGGFGVIVSGISKGCGSLRCGRGGGLVRKVIVEPTTSSRRTTSGRLPSKTWPIGTRPRRGRDENGTRRATLPLRPSFESRYARR